MRAGTRRAWRNGYARCWRGIKKFAVGGALLVLLCVPAPPALATTVTAVTSCNPCSQLGDLQQAAQNWFYAHNTVPQGTIILVTSLNAPISGFFRFTKESRGCCTAVAITPNDMGAGTLDNSIFARAAKVQPLKTPSNITNTDVDEVIIQYIQTQLVVSGPSGINLWHMLAGFPQVAWYTLTDAQTGASVTIYVGDTITVAYPGGYTEQWQFLGPEGGTIQWKRVPNTLMLNGKPVTQPTTASGTPAAGGGSADGSSPYGNVSLRSQFNFCYGVSSVTIESPDGSEYTSYGYYVFAC